MADAPVKKPPRIFGWLVAAMVALLASQLWLGDGGKLEGYFRRSPWIQKSEQEIAANVNKADREHELALQALIEQSAIDGRMNVHRPRGLPEQEIPRLIDSLQVDVLVMGTVARTNIAGFGIGNTAENAFGEIKCSLLALKPNGFVSSVRAY